MAGGAGASGVVGGEIGLGEIEVQRGVAGVFFDELIVNRDGLVEAGIVKGFVRFFQSASL